MAKVKGGDNQLSEVNAPEGRLVARQAPQDLRGWHELGKKTRGKFPEGATRAPKMIKKLATELGVKKDLILKAVVFARTFSPEELKMLCDLRTPSGKPLTFSHVRRVLSVESREKRWTLLKRAASEGWRNEKVGAAVIAEQGGPKSKGGRRPSRPRTPEEALRQITARTEEWLRRCENSWEDETGPLVTAKKGEPKAARNLSEPLDQASKALVRLGEATRRLEELLAKLAAEIKGQGPDRASPEFEPAEGKGTRSRRPARVDRSAH